MPYTALNIGALTVKCNRNAKRKWSH